MQTRGCLISPAWRHAIPLLVATTFKELQVGQAQLMQEFINVHATPIIMVSTPANWIYRVTFSSECAKL